MSFRILIAFILLGNFGYEAKAQTPPSIDDLYKELRKYISFKSPFPSTIPQTKLGNAHALSTGAYNEIDLIRGRTPRSREEFSSLINDLRITDFLIFKNQTKNEVAVETAILQRDFGFSKDQIHYIPMKYKDFDSFQSTCLMTVKALRLIREIERRKTRRLFFHCTLGEDRTGMLSGLWRIVGQNQPLNKSFHGEMCRWGYGAGNKNKPPFIVNKIRAGLTVHFHKMYFLLMKNRRAGKFTLGDGMCRVDPAESQAFQKWHAEAVKTTGKCHRPEF